MHGTIFLFRQQFVCHGNSWLDLNTLLLTCLVCMLLKSAMSDHIKDNMFHHILILTFDPRCLQMNHMGYTFIFGKFVYYSTYNWQISETAHRLSLMSRICQLSYFMIHRFVYFLILTLWQMSFHSLCNDFLWELFHLQCTTTNIYLVILPLNTSTPDDPLHILQLL